MQTWGYCLVIAGLLASLVGCSPSDSPRHQMTHKEIEVRLNAVLQGMMEICRDVAIKRSLESAQIFRGLQGLPAEIAGISIPIDAGTNQAHVSFTLDHLQKTPLEKLVAEALEDYETARSTAKNAVRK